MYFVAMVGGSMDYEPQFLLKLLGVVILVVIVLGGVLDYVGKRMDKGKSRVG